MYTLVTYAGATNHWIEARLELERIKKNSKGSEKVLRGLGP